MNRVLLALGIGVTLVVGAWATLVLSWIEQFDATQFNE